MPAVYREKGKRLDGYFPDYVLFDLETTGLSPIYDEIIELSAVKVKQGKVIDTFDTLVKPGKRIPYAATAVNGITNAMVKEAPVLSKVLPEFLDFIKDWLLVGHNIHSFDTNFIYDAALRLFDVKVTNDYVDTLYMARKCLPQLKHHRLGDLCEYFTIDAAGAHRALNDCVMNHHCYEKLGELTASDRYSMKRHTAFAGKNGEFYCRSVNALLSYREDQQVCGKGCPCFGGVDEKGYPVCSYKNLEILERPSRSPRMIKKRIDAQIAEGKLPFFPEVEGFSPKLAYAYQYAAAAHREQLRKGTKIPYLAHILTTMNYALQLTQDEEILTAAILHDTVEDTWVTLEDIEREFGKRVGAYLAAETENKRPGIPASETWLIRKQENVNHLQEAEPAVKIIVLADKTANAESMLREWRILGDSMWSKFNQSDKQKQAWYYRACADAMQEFADTNVMKCYLKYLSELFG